MDIIHLVIDIFFKIATTAVMVLFVSNTPIALPTTTTLPPWKLPETVVVATTTLPLPAPQIGAPSAEETSQQPKIEMPSPSLPAPQPKPVAQSPAPVVPTPEPLPASSTPAPQASDVNIKTREALVNVLCITSSGGFLRPISGSGIVIDPRGVVLTNAHIGQFFLLRDYPFQNNIQCVLRTGSPASPTYTAELLYFPKQWLEANASKIVQENPTGTGEYDFSLLLITGRTNPNASLPASLPFLEPYTGPLTQVGDGILLAGYPAGFLEGASIASNLYIASALGTIGEIFTFVEGGSGDLISVPGTILSQKGSSGGAAVSTKTGKLTGLIVTATLADTTAQRDLRAITLKHINLSMIADINQSLSAYLTGNVLENAYDFNVQKVPALSKLLTDVLTK